MASPQKENGFTPIAHEILEALSRTKLTNYESRIVFLILRETYGHHKKMVVLRHRYIANKTGIPRNHIHRTLKSLLKKEIIQSEDVGAQKLKYGLQKDWEKWENRPLTRCQTDPCSGGSPTPNEGSVPAPFKHINIKDREFPDENSDVSSTKGEQTSPFENPLVNSLEGKGSHCPELIGPVMDQLLKKKLGKNV